MRPRVAAALLVAAIAGCSDAPERAPPASKSNYVFADTGQLAHFGAPNSAPTSHFSVFAPALAEKYPDGGCVVIRFDIAADGSAVDPVVDFSEPPGAFDRYALASVRQSRWIPPAPAGPYYFWMYYTPDPDAEDRQRRHCTELHDARKGPTGSGR